MSVPTTVVMGVDIGNSNFSVSTILSDGKVTCLLNKNNQWRTPTRLRYVLDTMPVNVAVGKHTDDHDVYDLKLIEMGIYQHLPQIVQINNSQLQVLVNGQMFFTLEMLFAAILLKAQDLVVKTHNKPVDLVVIAMPWLATPDQYRIMAAAAHAINLTNCQFLPEPVTASITFTHMNQHLTWTNLLIIDFSHTHLNVSLVQRITTTTTMEFRILFSHSTLSISGLNFDERLYRFLLEDFKFKYGTDLDPKLKRDFRNECELVKTQLSTYATVTFNFDGFQPVVGRREFETVCGDQVLAFTRIIEGMKQFMPDAVVACGGCTSIPAIRSKLSTTFGSEIVHWYGDVAFSHGAAISTEMNHDDDDNSETRYAFGLHVLNDGIFRKIIDKNTLLPCHTHVHLMFVRTTTLNTTIYVCRQDTEKTRDNTVLGEIEFPELKEQVNLDVICRILDGLLTVDIADSVTGVKKRVELTYFN